MIHSNTKSASYTRDFAQKMKDRGHSRTRLTKPLRIRWHTCQSTVSEMFDYGDIILSILSKDTNTTVQSLCAYFMQPKTILLLPIVNHLLTMCKSPLLELQARDITFIQCKEIILQLRSDLASINEEVFRQHLPACCPLLDSDPLHVQIDEVLAESQTVVRILQRSLEDRFLTPDETSQLDFISHEFLLQPNSQTTDNIILSIAKRLQYFIPSRHIKSLLLDWHHMKSSYQRHFKYTPRTSSQILTLLLSNELFRSDLAMFPILQVIQTIACTSVETERTFSLLHHTQRDDRTRMLYDHLQILARISVNSPPELTNADISAIKAVRNSQTPISKIKRRESTNDRPLLQDDNSDSNDDHFDYDSIF
ncbi:hypothetical protein BLNAU_24137 [Blattamonas nauphoetae]|uniref:HAT C-terminal dimerisation domain-containing protein n=1 Tax=Blattamonas nauphoetae TaxID=2049346 RepID=A0ABQ9WR66_9EUKA|nr:hypothetical protein BLNAU_24137 [Blattamonas nauphoetae]